MTTHTFPTIPSLQKYVLKRTDKDQAQIEQAAREWVKACAANKITYECEWFGVPIIQAPECLVLMQEVIFKCRPDVLIETGVAHGGSLIFYSSLFELLGAGHVIGIDIDIRSHNREVIEKHPLFKRITLVEGSSTAPETVAKVRDLAGTAKNCMVCLDSDHKADHVERELLAYSDFIPPGGYIVVFDTGEDFLATEGVRDKDTYGTGPFSGLMKFLEQDDSFEIDRSFDKLGTSKWFMTFLKKKGA